MYTHFLRSTRHGQDDDGQRCGQSSQEEAWKRALRLLFYLKLTNSFLQMLQISRIWLLRKQTKTLRYQTSSKKQNFPKPLYSSTNARRCSTSAARWSTSCSLQSSAFAPSCSLPPTNRWTSTRQCTGASARFTTFCRQIMSRGFGCGIRSKRQGCHFKETSIGTPSA